MTQNETTVVTGVVCFLASAWLSTWFIYAGMLRASMDLNDRWARQVKGDMSKPPIYHVPNFRKGFYRLIMYLFPERGFYFCLRFLERKLLIQQALLKFRKRIGLLFNEFELIDLALLLNVVCKEIHEQRTDKSTSDSGKERFDVHGSVSSLHNAAHDGRQEKTP